MKIIQKILTRFVRIEVDRYMTDMFAIDTSRNDRQPTCGQDVADIIVNLVCERYQITRADLEGRSRAREIADPRHLAIYLINEFTELTLRQMSDFIPRDHSTMLHSIKLIGDMLTYDNQTRNNYVFLKKEINYKLSNMRSMADGRA